NPRPPALTDALTAVEATDPDIQKWFEAGKSGTPMPNIPAMAAVWDPFGKAEAAIIGGADVKSTLDAAQKAITTAIGAECDDDSEGVGCGGIAPSAPAGHSRPAITTGPRPDRRVVDRVGGQGRPARPYRGPGRSRRAAATGGAGLVLV